MGAKTRTAAGQLEKLAPLRQAYADLGRVLWPYLTVGMQPNIATPFATTDSRGYRLSRHGEATVASDDAPADAAFLIGGSYVFGHGANDDSATLPSVLWQRSGRPYVNLGLLGASSTQELISVLPFADRTTRFVVCSGINNLTAATGAPLDPLFGPSFFDFWLQKLQNVTMEDLVHLVWAARKGRTARLRPGEQRPPRGTKHRAPTDPDTIVANAAALQLRDLRGLRRLVPDQAEVVFALQPVALHVDKELTEEERSIFEGLDIMQRRGRWAFIKELIATHWSVFAAELADGCAKLGVPFVDLGKATYTGWCFLDRMHMNDRGNDIAATFLLDALS